MLQGTVTGAGVSAGPRRDLVSHLACPTSAGLCMHRGRTALQSPGLQNHFCRFKGRLFVVVVVDKTVLCVFAFAGSALPYLVLLAQICRGFFFRRLCVRTQASTLMRNVALSGVAKVGVSGQTQFRAM